MSVVKRVLHEANYVLYRLIDDQTLEIFSLEITTSKRATTRAHEAFLIGTEMGARDGKPWRDPPAPERHLAVVR